MLNFSLMIKEYGGLECLEELAYH